VSAVFVLVAFTRPSRSALRNIPGDDGGAFERHQRDIHLRAVAGADLLVDVESLGAALGAFADAHRAFDGEPLQSLVHGLHRRLVGGLLVAATHEARCRNGRGLGDADGFEGEIAVDGSVLGHDLFLTGAGDEGQRFPVPMAGQFTTVIGKPPTG
jgi:hypothetical protein